LKKETEEEEAREAKKESENSMREERNNNTERKGKKKETREKTETDRPCICSNCFLAILYTKSALSPHRFFCVFNVERTFFNRKGVSPEEGEERRGRREKRREGREEEERMKRKPTHK
jgi:hypothetical protein